jgi:chloride channel 7
LGVENISGFKFWATLTLLDRGQPVASFLVYALVNCALVGVSVYVTVNYAPAAAGSGIAEVKVSETMVFMVLDLTVVMHAYSCCNVPT